MGMFQKVPAKAASSNNVVEMMHHQLFVVES